MTDQILNFDTMTLEELDALDINALLGENLADVSLSSSLPDGTYVFTVDKYDYKSMAADVEKQKAARRDINITLKVAQVLSLNDTTIDPATLVGRMHFERYNLRTEFGQACLVKLMLGILGISFTDKKAIREAGSNPGGIIEAIKAEALPFGGTITNTEKNGYENCNLVLKERAFISADKVTELLG